MQSRQLGNSGIDASCIAFGAWAIGGWKWGGTDASEAVQAIRSSIDHGVNFVDTAAVYGFGLSEELVGRAIADIPRDSVLVATKCGLRWDIETPVLHAESDDKRIFRTLDAASIRWELDQSLTRLNTDYIDLYQTHWPDVHTDIEELMHTLNALKDDGKIRSIGMCNMNAEDLRRAASAGGLDVDQERYSMLDRERDADNLPLCAQLGLAFLAYSPMAQGLLSGKIDQNREFGAGDLRNDNPRFSQQARVAINTLLAPIVELARQKKLTTEQIVLAWTLQQPGLSHVLVGARNEQQAASNAVVGTLILSDEELNMISAVAHEWKGFDTVKQN